jgi:hypothetical protein
MASAFGASHREVIAEFGVTEEEAWAEAQKWLRVALENPQLLERLGEDLQCF